MKSPVRDFTLQLVSLPQYLLTDECIPWPFALDKDGYGSLNVDGKNLSHQRAIMTYMHGPLNIDVVVRHTCKLKPCCNPKHLQFGTAQQNVQDRIRDDTNCFGQRNGRSKLTEQDVITLFDRKSDGVSVRSLAKEYGVHHKTLQDMFKGKTWAYLNKR